MAGKIEGGKESGLAAGSVAGSKGRRVQVRASRANGWNKTKRKAFLDQLAATCNVRLASAAVGVADSSAFTLRRNDPQFAVLWAEALESGYEQIEAKLLARTIGPNPERLSVGDADAAGADDFDPVLALKVLAAYYTRRANQRVHRRSGPAGKRATIIEVRDALMVKLAALDKRLAKERARAEVADETGNGVAATTGLCQRCAAAAAHA